MPSRRRAAARAPVRRPGRQHGFPDPSFADISPRSSGLARCRLPECNSSRPSRINRPIISHWDPTMDRCAALSISKSKKLAMSPHIRHRRNCRSMLSTWARSIDPHRDPGDHQPWFDPQAARQAGTTLIQNGCDFLFGIMDRRISQVAEKRRLGSDVVSTCGAMARTPMCPDGAGWNAITSRSARMAGT